MIRLVAACFALPVLALPAAAQEAPDAPRPPTQYVSAGAAFLPDYSGSDEYRLIPFGALRLEVGDVVLRTDAPGLSAELVRSGPLTAGVFFRWSGGRNDVEDVVVARLEDVDNSILTGGFAELTVAQRVFGPADRITVGGRLAADATGTVEGLWWTGSVSYGAAVSRTSFVALSASVTGVSDDYGETLFSVDATGSAASGLPVFSAGGGIKDIGVTAVYDHGFAGGRWSVTSVVGWSRLLGDYADSPLVSVRGEENQAFVGLALGRRF